MDFRLCCFDCSLGNMREDEYMIPIGEFGQHNEEFHKSATYFCNYCPMRFYSKEDKFAHLQIDHVLFPCLECFRDQDLQYLDEDDFGLHYLHRHPLCKVVQCSVCPNFFSSQGLYDTHFGVWHVNLKPKSKRSIPRRCIHCNASIKLKHMDLHNKARHKGWDYQCSTCLCVFPSTGERDKHQQDCKI